MQLTAINSPWGKYSERSKSPTPLKRQKVGSPAHSPSLLEALPPWPPHQKRAYSLSPRNYSADNCQAGRHATQEAPASGRAHSTNQEGPGGRAFLRRPGSVWTHRPKDRPRPLFCTHTQAASNEHFNYLQESLLGPSGNDDACSRGRLCSNEFPNLKQRNYFRWGWGCGMFL